MENEKPKEEEKPMIKISYTLPPSAQKSKLKNPTPQKEEIIHNNEDNNIETISKPKEIINHSMIEKENEAYINNSLVMTPPKSKRFSSKSKKSIVQNIKLNSSRKQSTDKNNKDNSPSTQKKEEVKKLMEQLKPLSNQKKSMKKETVEEEGRLNEDKSDDSMKIDNEITQFGQYLEDNKIQILNNEPIQLEENSEKLFTTIDFWKKFITYIILRTEKNQEKIPISKVFELSLKCLSYKTHTKDEVLSFPDFFYDTIVTNYSSEEISNFLSEKKIEGNLSKENISTLFPSDKEEKKEDDLLSSKKIKKKSVEVQPRQVTKEDIELYKYELIMRNKVDLVINTANSFAFGTSKRKDSLLNKNKVVVENMQSFSLLQNNEKEKEEIIDTSMHHNKKITKNKNSTKPIPPEKGEEDDPSERSERSDSSEEKDKKKKGKTKKKSNGMKTRNRSNKKRKK